METKVLSKYHRQDEFLMSSGKKIFIERTFNKGSCELLHNSLVKLLKLATDKPEFPRGYKFS